MNYGVNEMWLGQNALASGFVRIEVTIYLRWYWSHLKLEYDARITLWRSSVRVEVFITAISPVLYKIQRR